MPHFVDTNVVVYAFGQSAKAATASQWLTGATISVQVLNEFANVAIRKLAYDAVRLEAVVGSIRSQVRLIAPIEQTTHDLAREIVFRYRLGFYDSALLAAAMLEGCDTFYSEDLQPGLLIEDQLRVINPFA